MSKPNKKTSRTVGGPGAERPGFEQVLFAAALCGAMATLGADPAEAVESALEAFLLARAALKKMDGVSVARPKAPTSGGEN